MFSSIGKSHGRILAAIATVGLAAAGQAEASTIYQFTGQTPGTTSTPVSGVFTGGFNDGTAYVTPANSSNSYLQFNGTNAYTATDDGSVTSIGQLTFGTGSAATVALNGTSLTDSGNLNSSSGSAVPIIENGSSTAVTLTNSGGNSALYAVIKDGGTASLSLATSGTAYLRLFGANTYSGGTTIGTGSTIEADNNTALGTGLVTLSGGTISVAGSNSTLANNITGSGTFSPYNVNLTLNGSLTGSGTLQRTQFSGQAVNSVFLNGNNSGFSGTFIVNSGALRFNSPSASSASALWIDNVGGNYFSLSAGNYSFGGLQGNSSGVIYNGSASLTTMTLGGRNDTLDNYSGDIGNFGGSGGANISVTKTGTGTQEFSGANVYTQGTTVSQGTLLVTNTSGSATGTGAVTVSSGATLAGTGIITGAVTINSGGILSPGDAPGTLTLSGGLTLANSSVLAYTLATPNVTGGTGGNDLTSTVALSLGTGVNLSITQGTGFGAGVYHLIDYTGSLTGGTNLSTWTISGLTGSEHGALSLGSDGSKTAVNLTVSVPEPATLGMLAIGGLGLLLTGRRRRA